MAAVTWGSHVAKGKPEGGLHRGRKKPKSRGWGTGLTTRVDRRMTLNDRGGSGLLSDSPQEPWGRGGPRAGGLNRALEGLSPAWGSDGCQLPGPAPMGMEKGSPDAQGLEGAFYPTQTGKDRIRLGMDREGQGGAPLAGEGWDSMGRGVG